MSEQVSSLIYGSFLITVSLNNSDEEGKYSANARNFFGQTISLEDIIKVPVFTAYGNEPSELIDQLKSDLDKYLENA